MSEKLEDLQKKYYTLFDELKEATPALTGEAYTIFAEDLLAKYKIERELLLLREKIEEEQEIDKLRARYARLVPQRWRVLGFLWHKKNYAATLNDALEDEFAKRTFAEIERQIVTEMRARCDAGTEVVAPGEVEGEPAEEPTNSVETPAETNEESPAEEPAEGADSAADGAGDVSAAPMSDEDPAAEPSEGGATLEEIEAKIAQDAWEKLAANAESADPKQAESDENDDVPEITENGDK